MRNVTCTNSACGNNAITVSVPDDGSFVICGGIVKAEDGSTATCGALLAEATDPDPSTTDPTTEGAPS